MQKEKAAILIAGIILILLGVSAAVNNIDYASGTNTTTFIDNQIQNELIMNSTATRVEEVNYEKTSGVVNKILGVILALVGLYFVVAQILLNEEE